MSIMNEIRGKRILIAGATGYLGRNVVRAFKERGNWVRALARKEKQLSDIKNVIDEVVVGEATQPETLRGICDDIDIVFSSLGITRQNDGLTYMDVDYQANRNLLDEAIRVGVKKFIFVSVLHGEEMHEVLCARAREKFVTELRSSSIESLVIRPTGFFSDMSDFFEMAKKGRVFLIGKRDYRINPIHGADLAQVCVDAAESKQTVIQVGGPDIFTHSQIAEIAFRLMQKPIRITRIPTWIIRVILFFLKFLNRRLFGIAQFVSNAAQRDMVAPEYGIHHLEDHYRQLLEHSS